MVLVDTSVILGFLRAQKDPKTEQLRQLVSDRVSFGIAAYTYLEVLQGARNKRDYAFLQGYLDELRIYHLPEDIRTYERAAHLYYDLRRKGITVRGAIDILIALTAIEYHLPLLHNDRDFDAMIGQVEGLESYEG